MMVKLILTAPRTPIVNMIYGNVTPGSFHINSLVAQEWGLK